MDAKLEAAEAQTAQDMAAMAAQEEQVAHMEEVLAGEAYEHLAEEADETDAAVEQLERMLLLQEEAAMLASAAEPAPLPRPLETIPEHHEGTAADMYREYAQEVLQAGRSPGTTPAPDPAPGAFVVYVTTAYGKSLVLDKLDPASTVADIKQVETAPESSLGHPD